MRLRVRKFKHRHANCFVIPLGAGKALHFTKVGEITDDLEEKLCYKLLGAHPEELELIRNDEELFKSKAAPRNKAASPSLTK